MRFSFVFALPFLCVACSSSTAPPADGGTHDLSTGTDSGLIDSGLIDSGPIDSGPIDSGSSDSSLADTGVSDGAPSDSATVPDGPILPPVDAGDPFGDAGTLGDPPWVDLDVRTSTMCPALVPCGGAIVGTWDVTGGCVAIPLGTALSACTGAMVTSMTGMARGRVTFDGTTARRTAQSNVEVDIFVPQICAAFVGGCSGIETRIMMMAPDSACVTTSTGDCNCAARQVTTIMDTDAYTTSGNEIIGTTSMKHWAYCVTGTSLSYQDVTATGMREPGTIHLGMR